MRLQVKGKFTRGRKAALMAACSNIGAHALSIRTVVLSRVSVRRSAHSSLFARRTRKSRLVASLLLRSLFRLYSCSHSCCCDLYLYCLEPEAFHTVAGSSKFKEKRGTIPVRMLTARSAQTAR